MTATVIQLPLATTLPITWECPSLTSLPGLTLGSYYDKEELKIKEEIQRYILRESARSPTFHNPLYCTELHQAVLRPFSHMSDLVLWWVEC